MKRRVFLLLCALLLCCALLVEGFSEPERLEVTHTTLSSAHLPQSFDGFRIAQLSDLHGRISGEIGTRILRALHAGNPDLIAVTGDFVDAHETDADALCAFASDLSAIAPTYLVTGNHEQASPIWVSLAPRLEAAGVRILDNEAVSVSCAGQSITLAGLCDPSFLPSAYLVGDFSIQIEESLRSFSLEAETFTVLLAHRPEYADTYADFEIDLALCGHTHGGQVRLPLLGAFYVPGGGVFPAYDAGLYQVEDTALYVSRGIGGGFRLCCLPELAILSLKCA